MSTPQNLQSANSIPDLIGAGAKTFSDRLNSVAEPVSPAPTLTKNPLQDLAVPSTQASQPDFDNVISSILDNPTPIAGADTPSFQGSRSTSPAPKAPKQGPLFGDVNIHFGAPPETASPDDRQTKATKLNESIF